LKGAPAAAKEPERPKYPHVLADEHGTLKIDLAAGPALAEP
jgi:hypothetical protein